MPIFDPHPNGAFSTLTNAPGSSGTSAQIQPGDGAKFAVGANFGWRAPGTVVPLEIGRVTAISGDTLTVTRHQEGTLSLNARAGWEIFQSITAKSLTDIETFVIPIAGGAPFGVTIANGADVAKGSTTDSSSTNTEIGLLKKIAGLFSGSVADGGADAGNTLKIGGVDGSAQRQPLKISGTGGAQVTQDTTNKLDDNIITIEGSDYPAQQLVTMNGVATTATFTQSLYVAGPAVESVRSCSVAIETSGIGQNITGATLAFSDTIGSTANVGPIYPLFNIPPTAPATAPTFLVGASTSAVILLPILDRGALRNAVLTLTLAGAGTNGGTIKVQFKFNRYELPVGPEYMIMANVQSQGIINPTTALCASAGANTRLYLMSGRVTNAHPTVVSRVTLLSGNTGLVLDGGVANPMAGFLLGPYGPYGLPMNAQARGLFIASTAAAALDIFVQLRVGT